MASSQAQSKLNNEKGSRRRRRILCVLVICFMCWAGTTFWNQAELISEKADHMKVMEQKLAETSKVNEQLKLQITRLNDNEYIEQLARKNYQMVGEGETLFVVPESNSD